MESSNITSIRILPSDKATFKTEDDFRKFITVTMIARGGLYYFPTVMMKCDPNTLVLFQYDGMIRAAGVLTDVKRIPVTDEYGISYAGYYKFDIDTLGYLEVPIDKYDLKLTYPLFSGFNQSKQNIDIKYFDGIVELLKNRMTSNSGIDFAQVAGKIELEMEELQLQGIDRKAFAKVRANQGAFRERLVKRYHKCCLCGVSKVDLLIASHIKPWSESAAEEKLDVDNGFLFCPNHDRVFDRGLITFGDDGHIIISEDLSAGDRIYLHINDDMKISLTEKNKKYLKFHRDNLFRKG